MNKSEYSKYFNICLFFFFLSCNSQDYKYVKRMIPKSYLRVKSKISNIDLNKFVEIEAYLPKGYKKNGTEDYTIYIQKALNENRNVIMPNFPILINAWGLKLVSNSKIYFPEKSKLFLKPNAEEIYHMILIKDCENIQIFNPRLVGDRKKHLGTKGEWGMGISIYQSRNVIIHNPYIEECWGDGIYLGREHENINNQNIKIFAAQLHDNRRNGISVISGINVLLENIVVSNTNGTLPMSGIVLEPNNNSDELDKITINNAVTFNNRYGIVIYLKAMKGTKQKDVNVVINSHLDRYSLCGLAVSDFILDTNSKPILGKIDVINPLWKNNQRNFMKYNNKNIPQVLIVEK